MKWLAVEPVPGTLSTAPASLTLAVAKRILKRAVDRNRFRRVVREALLARLRQPDVARSAGVTLQIFVRLVRLPADWLQQTARATKRAWRSEADALLAALRWPGAVSR